MGHRWLSTDNGAQCFRCGLVIDWRSPDEPNVADDRNGNLAHWLAPNCTGPDTGRAHHLLLAWSGSFTDNGAQLECACGDQTFTAQTEPDRYEPECVGA